MLKRRRVTTAEESVGAGEETDPLLLEALGQPVVLIQVDGGREGKEGPIRTNVRPQARW